MVLLLAATGAARAADPSEPGVYLELPAVDLPFQTANGGSWPSMGQSMWVTADLYQGIHYGLGQLADPYSPRVWKQLLGMAMIGVFDALTMTVPGLLAWQHEEWHRAVMSWRGVGSYNDVYRLHLTDSIINVSHVSDDDLVRLKAQHPADQVRLSMAGIEGNYAEAQTLENIQFFNGTRTWNTFLLWLLYIGNTGYIYECASLDSDKTTREQQAKEGADVARRDFTGLDCDGWTYDLFRPDEPYAARGPDPSGVGINRYRSYSQLAPAEQAFIRKQYHLSLLNFVDPNLLGVHRLRWPWLVRGQPVDFNLALRYMPAAFGYDLRVDLFLQRTEALNLLVSLHGYFNQGGPYPGLELQLFRLPAGTAWRKPVVLGLRVAGWLQPERLRYDASAVDPGGLVALRAGLGLVPAFEPYVEVEAKTAGWVAGNVFLDRNVSARMGVVSRF
jgi:hypothetical protein